MAEPLITTMGAADSLAVPRDVPVLAAGDITFYDSVNPHAIPSRDRAALYFDGLYGPAGQAAAHLFRHRRFITIGADYLHCEIVDFEPGNPCYELPGLLSHYLAGRASMKKRARIYCDRNDAAKAAAYAGSIPHHWWLATLDGRDWTPEELAADLAANFGVTIPANLIWANQNKGGPGALYDSSNLFREW